MHCTLRGGRGARKRAGPGCAPTFVPADCSVVEHRHPARRRFVRIATSGRAPPASARAPRGGGRRTPRGAAACGRGGELGGAADSWIMPLFMLLFMMAYLRLSPCGHAAQSRRSAPAGRACARAPPRPARLAEARAAPRARGLLSLGDSQRGFTNLLRDSRRGFTNLFTNLSRDSGLREGCVSPGHGV